MYSPWSIFDAEFNFQKNNNLWTVKEFKEFHFDNF